MTISSKLRSLTDSEVDAIYLSAAERRTMQPADRGAFAPPAAADSTLAGACLWSVLTLWQDQPALLVGGVLGTIAIVLIQLWHLLAHFIR